MKKLVKSKKGSAVVETIILMPFLIFLVLFSTFKIVSYLAFSSSYKEATKYARNAIICKTTEEMLNTLARETYDSGNDERKTKTNTSIISISITPLNGLSTEKITVHFDNYKEGKNTFVSFCKIQDGVSVFCYDNWQDKNKNDLSHVWQQGALLEIETMRDLTNDVLKDTLSMKIYDFNEKKRKTVSFGIETKIQVLVSNVISC